MIEVRNLSKSFDDFKVLNEMNLCVKKGSIYGLVGVNGSGKTTIIKHLTGLLRPDSGEVLMDGEQVYDNEGLKARMGFIPDELFFFNGYSLDNMAAFYKGMYPRWNSERYEKLLEVFDLKRNARISRFSKGMQKQAAFILVMSTMPDYLILDEPIDGLDPLVRHKLWKFVVDDVAQRQMTVLVSSHNLDEIEGICDSIGIIAKGEMKLESDLDDLRQKEGTNSLKEIFIKEMGGEDSEIDDILL